MLYVLAAVCVQFVCCQHIQHFDDRLSELETGSLEVQQVKDMFTKIFSEPLRPGIWTEPGLQMLEAYRGRKAAVLVAQCPQREAHWQVDDGCQTSRYMNILVEKVSRILLRSYYVSTR